MYTDKKRVVKTLHIKYFVNSILKSIIICLNNVTLSLYF